MGHCGPGTLERLEGDGGRALEEVLLGKPMEDSRLKTEGPVG